MELWHSAASFLHLHSAGSMDASREQAQRELIEELLACTPGETGRVLGRHAALIDRSFVLLLRGQAASRARRGDSAASVVLVRAANMIEHVQRQNAESGQARRQQLTQMLQIGTVPGEKAREALYSFVAAASPDGLDASLLGIFRAWADEALSATAPELQPRLAGAITHFGQHLQDYPRDRAGALEFAVAAYHAALQVFTPEGHPVQSGRVQNALGFAYRERIRGTRAENVKRAYEACSSAVQLFTDHGSPADLARAQVNLALACAQSSGHDRAANLDRAIGAAEEALRFFRRETFPADWAVAQHVLSVLYRVRPNGSRAENLEQAVSRCEGALLVVSRADHPVSWARAQRDLAAACRERNSSQAGDAERSIEACRQALGVFTRETHPAEWATTQSALGDSYLRDPRGNPDSISLAIQAYMAAAEVFTRESHPLEWAAAQSRLGSSYRELPSGDRAENLQRALRVYQAAFEVFTRDAYPAEWAGLQNGLGLVHSASAQRANGASLDLAIDAFQSALQVYTLEAHPVEWAGTQDNLGVAYRARAVTADDIQKAISAHEAALRVFTREDFPAKWAGTQNNLANTFQEYAGERLAEYIDRAIAIYGEVLEVLTKDASPTVWAGTQLNLGHAYRKRLTGGRAENLKLATRAQQAALEVFTRMGNPEGCLLAASALGSASADAGDWEVARDAFATAAEATERARQEVGDERRRREILLRAISVYAGLVEACIRTGAPGEALAYADQSKARGLADLLSGRDIRPSPAVPRQLLEELRSLGTRLPVLRRQLDLAGEGEQTRAARASTDQLERERERALLRQREVLDEIGRYDPELRLTLSVPPVRFEEMRELVDDWRAALVEWYFTETRLYAFILAPEAAQPVVVSYSEGEREEVDAWIAAWRSRQAKHASAVSWRGWIGEQLGELGRILRMEQVLAVVPENVERLLLVPHRSLHPLPLHALPVALGAQKSLLDRFPHGVQYAPSALLARISRRRTPVGLNSLLAVQNPTHDLSAADVEVPQVGRYFVQADILAHDEATIGAVRGSDVMRTAECVHFACHGRFDSARPLNSALRLAGGTELTLGEVFELPMDSCRLVTLSACEAGLTDSRTLTDEYVGFPSGFLFAGARCVVSPLWKVADASTALLMMRFYELLFPRAPRYDNSLAHTPSAGSVAVALNDAQRWLREVTSAQVRGWLIARSVHSVPAEELIQTLLEPWAAGGEERPFADPFHWAGFVAVGD